MTDELYRVKRLFAETILRMLREAHAAGMKNPRRALLDLHRDPAQRLSILHRRLGTVEGNLNFEQWTAIVDHTLAIDKTLPKPKRVTARTSDNDFASEIGGSFLLGW